MARHATHGACTNARSSKQMEASCLSATPPLMQPMGTPAEPVWLIPAAWLCQVMAQVHASGFSGTMLDDLASTSDPTPPAQISQAVSAQTASFEAAVRSSRFQEPHLGAMVDYAASAATAGVSGFVEPAPQMPLLDHNADEDAGALASQLKNVDSMADDIGAPLM